LAQEAKDIDFFGGVRIQARRNSSVGLFQEICNIEKILLLVLKEFVVNKKSLPFDVIITNYAQSAYNGVTICDGQYYIQ